jgi:eukaryotic-like serine/threonine-protein kinase
MSDQQLTRPADGTLIDGAYKVVRLVSRGSMGAVFEAVQLRLDRRVAVKMMAPDLAGDAESLARFRREVKILSKLAHPNVVQLLDFGTSVSGHPYIVTEFLDGEDLEGRLERVGPMPLARALPIVRQVASALAAIHGKGIVHRDLKPANVCLLTIDGTPDFVKVVDFGLSKVRMSTGLTAPETVLGTPEYMSPEQAAGRIEDVDHRSDQWALACLAWRTLTGDPPFGGHWLEVIRKIERDDPPPLLAAAPHLPAALERVLRRALAKRRASRYPTIRAFMRAFDAATRERPAPAAAGS